MQPLVPNMADQSSASLWWWVRLGLLAFIPAGILLAAPNHVQVCGCLGVIRDGGNAGMGAGSGGVVEVLG